MGNVPFVNHHVHSYFSVLDGMPSPEEIAQAVKDMGQTHFSLTDHGTMSGIPSAYRAAKNLGLGFTPGVEFYYTQNHKVKQKDRHGKSDYHLILLATSNDGYHNLLKMNTPAWTEGFYRHPRVDYGILEQYSTDVVATTSCLGGIVNQALMRNDFDSALEELGKMIDVFGKENVYIEMQNSGEQEKKLILPGQLELHKKTGVPLLATADSHYAHKCDHDYHDTLICTSIGDQKLSAKRNSLTFKGEYHLHSGEEMIKLFPEDQFPGAVSNTVELAERTSFSMKIDDDLEYIMPKVKTDVGKTESETLREHVYLGASDPKRYGDENGNIPDSVKERIDYELGVVENMGFSGYFLIVENIVKIFAEHGIYVGPGRGCLDGNTPVFTKDGMKPISQIKKGDKVVTKDGEWGTVALTHKYDTDPDETFIRVLTTDGKELKLTAKHLVLTLEEDKSGNEEENFKKSSALKSGDILVSTLTGGQKGYSMVSSIEEIQIPPHVYDLSIMDGHPSFLTSTATVHNSAPGSVSVYSLGITNVDPLANDLYFERFLNPDRITMPDIDIDVPRTRRREALMLMEKEYGKGHVACISNYGKYRMKESIKRVAKVYGNSATNAQQLANEVKEYCETQTPVETLSTLAQKGVPTSIRKAVRGIEHIDEIIEHASKIEGRMFSNSIHACGIVITTGLVDDHFPIRVSEKAILPVCQFDGDDASALGGVKMDILGLINLNECETAEENIRLDLGEDIDTSNLPLDDEKVYEMLSHGDGGGVFQLGCLAGDTIIDGNPQLTIEKMYLARNSSFAQKSIRSMYVGEGVIGYNDIEEIMYSGKKMLYTLNANIESHDKNISIKATKDHRFMTSRGWVKLEELSTGEKIVAVSQDDISIDFNPSPIRGKEDIFRMFEELYPDYTQIKNVNIHPVRIGEAIIYPTHWNYEDKSFISCLIPEKNSDYASLCKRECQNIPESDGRKIIVKTYSDVVEEYMSNPPQGGKMLLPLGTDMATITSIQEYGVEDTYDISMNLAAQSYIANDFIVHNSSGMKSLLKNMKPDEIADISSALALFRPGPMGVDTHNIFCVRKNNSDADKSVPHEDMHEILKKTQSLTVYQEDIMAIARHYAGYSGAEADELRKAVAKKIPAKMEIQKNKFIPAVNERYGDNLGQTLWDIIEPFGAYAFCKAHSMAYAFLAFRTAWIKAHYRPQFAGAVIDQEAIDKGAKEVVNVISWAREGGVKIYNPDINKSDKRTMTSKDSIILPLRIIDSIGDNLSSTIIDERNKNGYFKSVVDFVSRCSINKNTLIKMAKAGSFDSLKAKRAVIIDRAEDIVSLSKTEKSNKKISEGLFGDIIEVPDTSSHIDLETELKDIFIDDYMLSVDDELYGKWERESMGIILGSHPFTTVKSLHSSKRMLSDFPPIDRYNRESPKCKFSGIITNVENKEYSRGVLTTFDVETDLAIVPAVAFSKVSPEVIEGKLAVMEGKIENDTFGNEEDESFSPKAIVYTMKPVDIEKLKKQDRNKKKQEAVERKKNK